MDLTYNNIALEMYPNHGPHQFISLHACRAKGQRLGQSLLLTARGAVWCLEMVRAAE